MDQNSILLGNLQIFEPVTVITNVLLAGFCFYWAGAAKNNTPKFWTWFYFILGFSILLGAFAHGMYDTIDNPIQRFTRFFALMAVSASSLASVYMIENKRTVKLLVRLVVLQFLVFSLMVMQFNKFIFVTIHSLVGLGVMVGGIFIWQTSRVGNQAVTWMISGILVNASTAIIHTYKLSFHSYFNHNDISHIILIGGCFLMFKGAQSAYQFMVNNSFIENDASYEMD